MEFSLNHPILFVLVGAVLLLVTAYRYAMSIVCQNVSCHKNRICQQATVDVFRVFC